MDQLREFLRRKLSSSPLSPSSDLHDQHRHEYAPLRDPDDVPVLEEPHRMTGSTTLLAGIEDEAEDYDGVGLMGSGHDAPFNWVEYLIFGLVGVAMLWAWNMFLAASPYFAVRLANAPSLQHSSQSAIISVSTITNLIAMAILVNIQYSASYPYRINAAFLINIAVFVFLTLSTFIWTDSSPGLYLTFLLSAVAATAWAAGLMQNGAFAFAAGFGRPEYTQAIMTGQALAGVLPPVTQMASVILVPSPSSSTTTSTTPSLPRLVRSILLSATKTGRSNDSDPGPDPATATSAFIYFFTAVLVSTIALIAFQPLVRRHNQLVLAQTRIPGDNNNEGDDDRMTSSVHSIEEAERSARKVVGMMTLWHKLRWLACAVATCFAVAMFFPVFTSRVVSVQTPAGGEPGGEGGGGSFANPSFFIPLAFFFWNLGDLLGRVSSSVPWLSLRGRPKALMLAAVLRVGFLPLYGLCNVDGKGAVVESDWFYLVLVQLPFGLTNGWLGSSCMMAVGEWVEENEREAAGGFMGFALVAGLTVGSLASFSVAGGGG